eukprot:8470332-Pyramimonas_sp.AAC.1
MSRKSSRTRCRGGSGKLEDESFDDKRPEDKELKLDSCKVESEKKRGHRWKPAATRQRDALHSVPSSCLASCLGSKS